MNPNFDLIWLCLNVEVLTFLSFRSCYFEAMPARKPLSQIIGSKKASFVISLLKRVSLDLAFLEMYNGIM